jgi:hypothetical protein
MLSQGMASETTGRPAIVRRRLKRILLIALGLVVFVAISGLLARWLTVENLERDMDLELVQAEARGDGAAMIAKLHGCRASAACHQEVARLLAMPRVHRHGEVKILDLETKTGYTLTGATGETRFAWATVGTLPVVQCIEVDRSGNPIAGIKVSLLSISAPIPNEGDC